MCLLFTHKTFTGKGDDMPNKTLKSYKFALFFEDIGLIQALFL